ncbi:MAG: type II toxin-antitoxin system VapC family toxin [Hyphomonadaceae bacterium]|nr:type II toxin-antitoxin system VapC family toxin [Hyphomonadaceae bacterium]
MIGLDTNVVVRFLAQDDDVQSPIATRFMNRLSRERPGFVGCVVLAEITWVLSRAYKASRDDIAAAVEGLLRSSELVVENAPAAYRALAIYRSAPSAEYADALISEIAALAGASETVTFDTGAAAELGMRLLR